jgi:hypothetical protein
LIDEERLILTGSADWVLVADQARQATQISEKAYAPIQPFIINTSSNAQYFLVTVNASYAKQTWRWAGTLGRVFPFSPVGDTVPQGRFISDEQSVFLNRSQFLIYRRFFSPSFDFLYAPPAWFRDVRIRLHRFNGDIVNSRQEQLDRIEQQVSPQ